MHRRCKALPSSPPSISLQMICVTRGSTQLLMWYWVTENSLWLAQTWQLGSYRYVCEHFLYLDEKMKFPAKKKKRKQRTCPQIMWEKTQK